MRFKFFLFAVAALIQPYNNNRVSSQITCTDGRVFIADEQQPVLHAIDADDGEVYDADVAGPSAHIWISGSGTVVSSYSTGLTQFFHSGLIVEDLQDHKDIEKQFPFAYEYSVSGSGGSAASRQVTESHGYIGLYYGSSNAPSTAIFVKSDDFQDTPNVNPQTISLQIGLGHSQGIAMALSQTRFLASVANGFTVLDQNGVELHNFANLSNPSGFCMNYGGSGFNENQLLHICDNNIMTMQYHPDTDVMQTKVIHDIGFTMITSNALNDESFIGYQPGHGINHTSTFVRFKMDSVTQDNIMDPLNMFSNDATDIIGLTPCAMFYEHSAHHHVIVFWPTGRLDVLDPGDEDFGLERSMQVMTLNGQQLVTCNDLSFTAGVHIVYISHKPSQTLYTVDFHEDHPHPLQQTSLLFVPGNIELFYQPQVLCDPVQEPEEHEHLEALTNTNTISTSPGHINTAASSHVSLISPHMASLIITMLFVLSAF